MLTTFRTTAAQLDALERVRAWTRNRFGLGEEAPVFVAEVACALPGCPPLETVVGFWTADGIRRHFKVFKPVLAVLEDDLPFAWLIDALAVADDAGCNC
jgi:nitrate reductase delta subunit